MENHGPSKFTWPRRQSAAHGSFECCGRHRHSRAIVVWVTCAVTVTSKFVGVHIELGQETSKACSKACSIFFSCLSAWSLTWSNKGHVKHVAWFYEHWCTMDNVERTLIISFRILKSFVQQFQQMKPLVVYLFVWLCHICRFVYWHSTALFGDSWPQFQHPSDIVSALHCPSPHFHGPNTFSHVLEICQKMTHGYKLEPQWFQLFSVTSCITGVGWRFWVTNCRIDSRAITSVPSYLLIVLPRNSYLL